MCGIVGAVKKTGCVAELIDGLRQVAYRGYDSAGISVHSEGSIQTLKRAGKLEQLTRALSQAPLEGTSGIGHTRWATHGEPSSSNAHPHTTADVSVVHNGIIENHRIIRRQLEAEGYHFRSETDSEVIPHLISQGMARGMSPEAACIHAMDQLQGSFALGVMFDRIPDLIFAARRGSPLVLGRSDSAIYLGSDSLALADNAEQLIYMEEGDWATLEVGKVSLHNRDGSRVERPWVANNAQGEQNSKQHYRHYMHKEIHEQPDVLRKTLHHSHQQMRNMPIDLRALQRLTLVGCGTSAYAAQVARYWFERYAGMPVDVDLASEYRYRPPVVQPGQLALFISQSGETADTLAAMHFAATQGIQTAALVNVPHSSMARDADLVLYTDAGSEIGVASTKAFTCQLATLAAFAIQLGVERGHISSAEASALSAQLATVPQGISQILESELPYKQVARRIAPSRDAYFIGRGSSFAIAMEGALKLKEISYIHAEGYSAGELKHGPIAMIETNVPVVVLAPHDDLIEKTLSNMQEVQARGGRCILITDRQVLETLDNPPEMVLSLPDSTALTSPLLYAVAMQLLAYHVALVKGTNVDQPRNLAKSVTVE